MPADLTIEAYSLLARLQVSLGFRVLGAPLKGSIRVTMLQGLL